MGDIIIAIFGKFSLPQIISMCPVLSSSLFFFHPAASTWMLLSLIMRSRLYMAEEQDRNDLVPNINKKFYTSEK